MSWGAQQERAPRTRGVAVLDRLVVDGRIPPERYDEVMIHAQRTQSTAEEAMIQLGLIHEGELLKYIANLYRTRFVSSERLSRAGVDANLLRQIPRKLAKRLTAFPILFDSRSRTLSVVAADVADEGIRQQMLFASGARDVKIYVAREAAIRAAIAKHYDHDNRPFEMLLSGLGLPRPQSCSESEPPPGWGQVFEERDGLLVHHGTSPRAQPHTEELSDSVGPEPPTETQPRVVAGTTMAEALSAAAEQGPSGIEPKAYLETLNVLVTLIEQLNQDRGGHSGRVARVCEQLGARIRLTEPQVRGILVAAYLHDIGVSAESHVTPLDAAQDEAARERARRVYTTPLRLLESVTLPETALDALRHRYETFDGRGFPERLSGKDIPLGARVLSVAESYIDLTQSERNLAGRRLSADDACDLLDRHKGTTFDPAVVDWLRHIILDYGLTTPLLASRSRVLAVEPDAEESAVLEVRFAEQGSEVVIERAVAAALKRLDAENFDLVVSEVELPDADGFDLLRRMRERGHNAVPLMFLTTRRDQSSIRRGLELGAADYVVKPASAAVVAAKAGRIIEQARDHKPSGRGVSGSLREMSLPDVIQILANGRKSGRLEVRSATLKGEMMFQDGSIHDAIFGDLTGADAVYGILRLTDGDFVLDPEMPPVDDKIGIPTHHLLLEAMRRLDESGR